MHLIYFEKKINIYLKLEIRVVCREYIHKYIFIVFFEKHQMIFYICKSETLKLLNLFSVNNIHLNLCGQVKNSKWILCRQKTGVKRVYLRF